VSGLSLDDPTRCAEAIVDRVGRDIRLAVPIGIGKPILLIDALYALAEADRRIKLSIFTGLTLTRPRYQNTLERRFVEPILDRLFATYSEPRYVAAVQQDNLPANISVTEFFLQAGTQLASGAAQRNHTSLNYSHVAGHLEHIAANVFAQLVAPNGVSDARVSLSSNTDVTLDMLPYIRARRRAGLAVVIAGELNSNLPYMPGEAEIGRDQFDVMLEPKGEPYAIFAPPKQPVSLADYAMALNAATLIKDGGTLQIGIGSFADAFTHALLLRHQQNAAFRSLVNKLATPIGGDAELAAFDVGLYGCTEMLVDGFLSLKAAGILKRKVPVSDGGVAVLHAGFFVGNPSFYRQLREMSPKELAEICMTAISFTNTLEGDAVRKQAERPHARFVNTAMTANLLGALAADTLEDGRVVSGVGGQLDLVSMAHRLPGARSIIAIRSTRRSKRRSTSNIIWRQANATIPRSLRDIVVTEYGIADLRGKSDRDSIAQMLAVADSAFQPHLRDEAQRAGKLEPDFMLPERALHNRSERIEEALAPARQQGLLPAFPLGSDMTATEALLVEPLQHVKEASYRELLGLFAFGITRGRPNPAERAALKRLGLDAPRTMRDRALSAIVTAALGKQAGKS
jgi:acyl-CoA hydrolase